MECQDILLALKGPPPLYAVVTKVPPLSHFMLLPKEGAEDKFLESSPNRWNFSKNPDLSVCSV